MKDLRGEVDLRATEVDFRFQITEGSSNLLRQSRGRFGETEVNLIKHLARYQGSETNVAKFVELSQIVNAILY